MTRHAEDPSAGSWAVVPLEQVVDRLLGEPDERQRPLVVAVDRLPLTTQ